MGELMNQMMTDERVGSFFARPDVVAAAAEVSDEAKDLLAKIVRHVIYIPNDGYGGKLHNCIVFSLSAAFGGEVDRFFHDCLMDCRIRDQAVAELRRIERQSTPPTCPLDHQRLPLVKQLLALADMS